MCFRNKATEAQIRGAAATRNHRPLREAARGPFLHPVRLRREQGNLLGRWKSDVVLEYAAEEEARTGQCGLHTLLFKEMKETNEEFKKENFDKYVRNDKLSKEESHRVR